MSKKRIEELEAQNKKYEWIMILAGSMVIFMFALAWLSAQLEPAYWCDRWGGTLFSDNSCHIIEQLDYCVSSDGSLRESSRAVTMPKINLNLTEGGDHGAKEKR